MVWKLGKKHFLATIAVISILAAGIFYTMAMSNATKSVQETVKKLYELANPGTQAEVLTLTDDSGLYKAVIKLTGQSGSNYAEVWVTKDGKYLTQNFIFVKDSLTQIENYKNFVDCLDSRGLRIYGVTNQTTQGGTATLMQLNLLGIYSPKIFVSCDGENLEGCMKSGITQVPTIVFEEKGYVGVRSISQLSEMTACKFES